MTRTARRKQLALILCCSFAGTLAAVHAGDAVAQAPAPLRVDPVLLGLPPVKKEEAKEERASVPAKPEAPKTQVEVVPVEPAAVEVKTVVAEPEPESPRDERGTAVPAVEEKAPAAQPGPAVSSLATVAPKGPSASVVALPAEKPAVPVIAAKPVAAPASPDARVSALEPLRVDPALLGLPPIAPVAQAGVSGAGVTAVRRAAAGSAAGASGESAPGQFQSDVVDVVDDGQPALALRAARKMETPPKNETAPRPAFLSAQRMSGEVNREFNAEGEAELRKIGTVVNADRLTYWPLDDEMEAEGGVRLQQGEDVVTGPKMRLRIEDQVGYFEKPAYQLKRQLMGGKTADDRANSSQRLDELSQQSWWDSGFSSSQTRVGDKLDLAPVTETRGEADRLEFEGENHYRLLNNTFTTCPIDNNDWYVRTSEMRLDYDREVGEGDDATVYFKDVPFLYSPWISFSLSGERKSGFLRPSFGTSSDNGFEYEQPYYWNIAPNMDATFTPRLMSKRGIQLNNEFRYLNTAFGGAYTGKLQAELLPDDKLRDGDRRYGISLRHDQKTSNGFTGLINYNKVSDDDYYTDLSSDIASTSQTQLLQQGKLTYSGGGWWSTSINFQQYQTLQPDEDNPVLEQYRMLPQITFNARKPDFHHTDLSFLGQYTSFSIREREQYGTIYPDGKRTVLYPQIALPYVTPGWYVTPKFGVNYRSYSLSGQAAGSPDSISVSLPIFSLDTGMTFERSSNWFGRDYTQTLEPRLYYLNIPYKDQSDIPLFDTALADFNFAQIFSENQFSGWDRVNNANQLTAALTSRLIEPDTGNEIIRAMIGQRFYFTRSKVGLNDSATTTSDSDKWDRSDFLAAFSGQILPRVYADTAWQFDLADQETERYSVGLRYQPEPGKVLNAAYRYNRDETAPINQLDLSGQWPISGPWYAVGRLNYAFKDDGTVLSTSSANGRVIQSVAGLEYNGGCWVLRGVLRRQALTSEDASTSFFVQLELGGLGRIGSNPLGVLKDNIQGYSLIGGSGESAAFEN
ncbi:LPS assembly protein LptD [Propionivibrio sp.]|uniref:LPS assembly protein LptD n=1 Tax=Propionivibrio sp. TaxID=2212460 RepID=UPI00272E59DC|nr:LPS assembly protein LptD [Propionivibrio sp.]